MITREAGDPRYLIDSDVVDGELDEDIEESLSVSSTLESGVPWTRVIISDPTAARVRGARSWCKDHFGPIPIKVLSVRRGPGFYQKIRVYDREQAQWLNHESFEPKVGSTRRNTPPNRPSRFYFRDPEKALLFRLTWG